MEESDGFLTQFSIRFLNCVWESAFPLHFPGDGKNVGKAGEDKTKEWFCMKANFFRMLALCEKDILDKDWFQDVNGVYRSYGNKTQEAVLRLVAYIEDGGVFHAKVPVFICRNWRMSPKELTELWETETGRQKRVDTFRGQVSEASVQLYSIFGDGIFEDLLLDDTETARSVSGTVSILKAGDTGFAGLESAEVLGYLTGRAVTKKFGLDECADEIRLLRKYCRPAVRKELAKVDLEKLCYLKSVLDQPLLDKDTKCMNNEKSELLRMIGGVK